MSDVHINAIAFKEGDVWVVQGIEYDITTHVYDVSEVPDAFMKAVFENACITLQLGRKPLEGIKPAPLKYKAMYESASTTMGTVKKPEGAIMSPEIDIRLLKSAA